MTCDRYIKHGYVRGRVPQQRRVECGRVRVRRLPAARPARGRTRAARHARARRGLQPALHITVSVYAVSGIIIELFYLPIRSITPLKILQNILSHDLTL